MHLSYVCGNASILICRCSSATKPTLIHAPLRAKSRNNRTFIEGKNRQRTAGNEQLTTDNQQLP